MKNNTYITSVIIVCGIILGLTVTSAAFAQTPTDDTTASPSAEVTTSKLKERIEKIVEEKRDQIKGVLSNLDQKSRGFIGEVQRVSEETITIKNSKGTEIIALTADPSLQKAGKTITIDDVGVGDWLVVMGIIGSDDAFEPKRILVSSDSLQPPPLVTELGTITEISKSAITFTSRADTQTELTLTVAKSTLIEDSEEKAVKLTDIETNMQALIIGVQTDKGVQLNRIRLLTSIAEK